MNINPVFHQVYSIDRRLAIKLKSFAAIIHFSDTYLLQIIKKLLKRKIRFGYKCKRNWYIFLPSKTIVNTVNNASTTTNNNYSIERQINLPNGQVIDINWQKVVEQVPPLVAKALIDFKFNFLTRGNELTMVGWDTQQLSSTLSPKNLTPFVPLSQGSFKATTEYKYG